MFAVETPPARAQSQPKGRHDRRYDDAGRAHQLRRCNQLGSGHGAWGVEIMIPAAALLLLGTSGSWTCVNLDPLTTCQPTSDVCVTAGQHEMLVMERDADTITSLTGPVADVTWNLIVLRAADAMARARDRMERALQDRRGGVPR